MTQPTCPCGSGDPLDDCCGRYHQGHPAPTAEALMRSRYSAYALGLVDYLRDTTLPAQQAGLDLDGIRAWSHGSTWLGLEVENHEVLGGQPEHARVTFVARWHDAEGEHAHRECSGFVQRNGRWYFLDPTVALKLGQRPLPLRRRRQAEEMLRSVDHLMHSLASYIRAIHALPSPVSISDAQVEEQQRCEDGVEIHSCEALYRFDNGVRLRQHCERDLLPSSGACEECWIGYEVLDSAGREISPRYKHFVNACQERFWLRMHA